MFAKLPQYLTEPLEQIEKAKKRQFKDSGDETKTRRVNYYYEVSSKQGAKAISRKLSPKASSGNLNNTPQTATLPGVRFIPCPRLVELLVVLRRLTLLQTSKIDILRSQKKIRDDLSGF